MLVIDETGFAKKGRASAGVARQFAGSLGGVFPCQVGVMAAWATAAGQALIDRELYLPKEWTDDRERCRAAHVPGQVGFATKPRQAGQMIDRILPDLPEGRVRVAADEVYGRDGAFRAFLEEHRLPYAVTVQANQTVLPRPGWRHIARLVQRVASGEDWAELPAGPSQAGTRAWQWRVRRIPDPDSEVGRGARARWIIARRRPGEPQERDYFFAWGPGETPVEELVRVPGARWRAEDAVKLAESACGLADYEVRSYHGWYRHITLAMLAAACLAVQDARAAREREPAATPPAQRGGGGSHSNSIVPIRFTACEIRRLLVLTQPQLAQTERLRRGLTWSRWRRCHQAVARDCHRRRNRARASMRAPAPPPPQPS